MMTDTAIVALVVGIGAGVVTWQQWRVAKAKLKLDLFEHRYALFDLLWEFMSRRVGDLNTVGEVHKNLQNSIPKFYFFFGEEIGEYVDTAVKRGIEQSIAHTVAQNPANAAIGNESATNLSQHYAWFSKEAIGLRVKFAKYLNFEEWS